MLPPHFAYATSADVPELESLVNSAYRGESSKKGWTTEADLLDGIRIDKQALHEMINKPGSVIIIHRNAQRQLEACVHLEKRSNKLYLGMLTVEPNKQSSGMGKKMLAVAEGYAKFKGIDNIEMTVISSRKELIDWYRKRGYEATDETRPFPKDPRFGIPKQAIEFVVLRKQLV